MTVVQHMQKKRERKNGIDEGRKSEKRDNAKRMKELKMSDEQICQILNITADELKELIGKQI